MCVGKKINMKTNVGCFFLFLLTWHPLVCEKQTNNFFGELQKKEDITCNNVLFFFFLIHSKILLCTHIKKKNNNNKTQQRLF